MDNVKKAAEQARRQAAELAGRHGSTIDQAIQKTGAAVDQRTGGKYTDKITKAQQAARTAREKVAGDQGPGQGPGAATPPFGTTQPGATPPPPTGPGSTPPPPPGQAATPPPPPPGPATTPPPPPGPAATPPPPPPPTDEGL